ncbi:MAG: type I-E CRISPR-associated protein Cse2/CasB [Acidobacteria bacterium]|nr:type I-E CRISPR-associated protein Cse2/CasB [Acidobacteriota bacterium]
MSTKPRPPLPVAVRFLSYLQRYRKDRGAMANLRGALSDTRRPNAWPLLAGFPDAIGSSAFETVAALWASGSELSADGGDLGDTMVVLMKGNNSFEGRFKRLLTCDRDEIAAYVAPVIRTAQARGLRVNYTQLLSDLLCWGDDVKVRWARSFWGNTEAGRDIDPKLLDVEELPA